MKKLAVRFAVMVALLVIPFTAFASVGVGVGTGKIQVDKILKPGTIYPLPPLTVVNTGTEPTTYSVSIDTDATQTTLKPEEKWFSFDPSEVQLEPAASKMVNITMSLPINARPGDYFAYVQAQPIKAPSIAGSASIGVAAAAKLYFTVAPANVFEGVYYRFLSIYGQFAPWDTYVLILIVLVALVLIFKKYFKIQIGVNK